MTSKELVALFREVPWRTTADVDAFAAGLGPVEAQDILPLLEVVSNRWLSADNDRHTLRCYAFGRIAAGLADKQLFTPYVRLLKSADGVLTQVLIALIPIVNNVAEH